MITSVRSSLRWRIYTLFTVAAASLSLFVYLFFSSQYQEHTQEDIREKAASITSIASLSVASPFERKDQFETDHCLVPIKNDPSVRFIILLDERGETFYSYQQSTVGQKPLLSSTDTGLVLSDLNTAVIRRTVRQGSVELGTITIGLSIEHFRLELERKQFVAMIISIAIFLAGMISVLVITRIIVRPINNVVSTFHQSNADLFEHVPATGIDEIDRLGESFNKVVDELAAVQKELHSINRTLEQRVDERTQDLQNEIHHHKSTGNALRESEERYRTLVELSPDAIIVFTDGRYTYINSASKTIFGEDGSHPMSEVSLPERIKQSQRQSFKEMVEQILQGSSETVRAEYLFLRNNGEEFVAEATATRLRYQGTNAVQIVIRDISERIRNERQRLELEQQLLHVQKKEIIGTLSSGIAHDILNILGIIGTAINKLLFLKNRDEKALMETAEQISKATERGKSLVKQLLTFARKTELNFDSTQVNAPVMEIVNVIQRTFPASISIDARLNENLPLIRADNNQLHQAMLNLCLNARDAIHGEGSIIIETTLKSAMRLNGAQGKHGEYICISVADTGTGMTPEVLQRIYEPFFTTKNDGTGSGLGLAMVKGIVENHRGFIDVESEEGKGTVFRMYFPV